MRQRVCWMWIAALATVLLVSVAGFGSDAEIPLPEGAIARLGTGYITSNVCYSPDGQYIAVGTSLGIELRDAETLGLVRFFMTGGGYVKSIAFAPNGRTLASVGERGSTITIWDIESDRELLRIETGYTSVRSFAFLDGEKVGCVGTVERPTWGWRVSTWSTDRGGMLKEATLDLANLHVGYALISGIGGFIVLNGCLSTGESTTVLYDFSGAVVSQLSCVLRREDGGVFVSMDGQVGVANGISNAIVWHDEALDEYIELSGNFSSTEMAVSPDGQLVACRQYTPTSGTRSCRSFIALVDANTGETVLEFNPVDLQICSYDGLSRKFAFTPDGRKLAAISAQEIEVWDVVTGEIVNRVARTVLGRIDSLSIGGSIEGFFLALVSDDDPYPLLLIDGNTGLHLNTFFDQRAHAFDPSGELLAVGTETGRITLWDIEQGKATAHVVAHEGAVDSLVFSPDGENLASRCSTGDDMVKLWQIRTGDCINQAEMFLDCNSLLFSPDGRTLITTSDALSSEYDPLIGLWNTATGQEMRTIEAQGAAYATFRFSSDGLRLIGWLPDGTIKIWNAFTGTEVETLTDVYAIALSPNGVTFVGRSTELGLTLCSVETGEVLHLLDHQAAEFASYSCDVSLLATASSDGGILIWDLAALIPVPPKITRVSFPYAISVGESQEEQVVFSDINGDIVEARFEIVEGDVSMIVLGPSLSFDPEVAGETDGAFRFTVRVAQPQTVTIRLILVDATGLESDPYEFTFTAEQQ